jgi:hypothetical protein
LISIISCPFPFFSLNPNNLKPTMKLSQSAVYVACLCGSVTTTTGLLPMQADLRHHPRTTATTSTTSPTTTSLSYEQDGSSSSEKKNDNNNNNNSDAPPVTAVLFSSPVLEQVYPALLRHKEEYGHPNIPLGNKEGRQCNTLRRLHIQNKLTQVEVGLLEEIGFTFHSLEEVYEHGADFDELFTRMLDHEARHPEHSNFQIPKKCPEDPELGAWVTGIRRLGPDGVQPEHARRLHDVGFAWKSTRKCGSKFMNQYRDYIRQVQEVEGVEGVDDDDDEKKVGGGAAAEALLSNDPKAVPWVQAQQEVLKRGNLSQTRIHYMEQLFGEDWTTIGKTTIQ